MNVFWPDIDDAKSAHKACLNAAGMAFFVAILTGIIAWLQASGKINILPGIEKMAIVDVGLFVLIGVGLCFHSRIAALAGLLLYMAERAWMIKTSGFQPGQVVGIVLFGLIFANGVRGAFAWHQNKKKEKVEGSLEIKEEIVEVKPKKNFPTRELFLLLILLSATGAAYYFLIQKGSSPDIDALKQKASSLVRKVTPKKVSQSLAAPEDRIIKLKLKSGRLFDGVLVKEDTEGYWVFIEGMGDIFFSMSEVAEVS